MVLKAKMIEAQEKDGEMQQRRQNVGRHDVGTIGEYNARISAVASPVYIEGTCDNVASCSFIKTA